MKKYSYGNLPKSSLTLVGLLFSFALFAFDFPRDTLIIDGKVVVVERNVTYSSEEEQNPEEEADPKKERKPWDIYYRAGLAAGLELGTVQAQGENRLVDDLFEKSNPFAPVVALHAVAGVRKKKFNWELGLEFGATRKRVTTFEASDIEDPLISLSAVDDELLQIYFSVFQPPFKETDTVAVAQTKANFQISYAGLSLASNYVFNRKESLSPFAGARLAAQYQQNRLQDAINYFDQENPPEILTESAFTTNSIAFFGGFEAGVIYRKRKKELFRFALGTTIQLNAQDRFNSLNYSTVGMRLSASLFL